MTFVQSIPIFVYQKEFSPQASLIPKTHVLSKCTKSCTFLSCFFKLSLSPGSLPSSFRYAVRFPFLKQMSWAHTPLQVFPYLSTPLHRRAFWVHCTLYSIVFLFPHLTCPSIFSDMNPDPTIPLQQLLFTSPMIFTLLFGKPFTNPFLTSEWHVTCWPIFSCFILISLVQLSLPPWIPEYLFTVPSVSFLSSLISKCEKFHCFVPSLLVSVFTLFLTELPPPWLYYYLHWLPH